MFIACVPRCAPQFAQNLRIGDQVGQRNLAVAANTYTHVLADEQEVGHADLLA